MWKKKRRILPEKMYEHAAPLLRPAEGIQALTKIAP
jgi:hypothetical protein